MQIRMREGVSFARRHFFSCARRSVRAVDKFTEEELVVDFKESSSVDVSEERSVRSSSAPSLFELLPDIFEVVKVKTKRATEYAK